MYVCGKRFGSNYPPMYFQVRLCRTITCKMDVNAVRCICFRPNLAATVIDRHILKQKYTVTFTKLLSRGTNN